MNREHLHESIRNFSRVSYSRSGGPGGQNVNKVNTKVTLRIRLEDLDGLTGAEYEHMKLMLAPKLSNDNSELVIQSDDERLQSVNEENAYLRIEALIAGAARLPKKRRPTRPTRASKEERLKTKKITGQKKINRSPPTQV